jgi:hypothetical protein
VAKLRESSSPFGVDGNLGPLLARGDAARGLAQQIERHHSYYARRARFLRGFQVFCFSRPGTLEATSFYDTTLLKATLERLVECRKRLRSQAHVAGGNRLAC